MGGKGGSQPQPMAGGMPQMTSMPFQGMMPMRKPMPPPDPGAPDPGVWGTNLGPNDRPIRGGGFNMPFPQGGGGRGGGGRGGGVFGGRGGGVGGLGTQPQVPVQTGKGGGKGGSVNPPDITIPGMPTFPIYPPSVDPVRPQPVPRRSLMDQYAGLNQGVREFEPLGIRGYTPPVYNQPMGGGWNPFQYNAFGGLDTFQPDPTVPTPPPVVPTLPTLPITPWDPFNNPWEPNPWDDRDIPYQQMSGPPRITGGPRKPWETRYDPISYREPMGPIGLPPINFNMPIPQTGGGFPSFDPLRGQPNRRPEPIMPIQGLTADASMYQPNLPFASSIMEQLGPIPSQIGPSIPEPVMPERFGIGVDQEVIESNPVLARRARGRTKARERVRKDRGWSRGGLVKLQEGGVVDGGMKLEEEVIAAVLGQHPNPDEVFKRYIDAYGEEGLMELLAMIEQMIPQDGRMVDGAGGGLDDAIPAMIDGTQPAALSKDEYVIPADVVAHAGDGSSEAGGKSFDNLVAKVRKEKTGTPVQPEEIQLEEVAEGVIV